MPTASQSAAEHKTPAATSARRRVTDVRERLFAQGMAVTTAGGLVAMHLHTASGTVVVTMDRSVFAAARAARDANGVPFHARAEVAEVAPLIDPPVVSAPVSAPAPVGGETSISIFTRRSPEFVARLRRAVAESLVLTPISQRINRIAAIAEKYRLGEATLRRAITRARAEIAEHGERPADL